MPTLPKSGDVVYLNSGGPRLTIIDENGDKRTAGYFLYNQWNTLTADAEAFKYSSTPDPLLDTAETIVIPTSVSATPGDETSELFNVGLYSLAVSVEGDRTMTVDVLAPTNTSIDFETAVITVTVAFAGYPDVTLDVSATYVSTEGIKYNAGSLVRVVKVSFPEPSVPETP